MKVEEATDTIAKFFNDLIGAWVPGAILATGLAVMHLGPLQMQAIFKLGDTTSAALTFAGILFAAGHALLAVHEQILKRLLVKLRLVMRFDEADAKKRKSYEWFAELVKAQQTGPSATDWSYNDLRSVALSVSAEAASVGRRFMFISLLCNGVGTSLAILAIDFAVCCLAAPQLLHAYEYAAPWPLQAVLLMGTALVLFKQGDVFYSRAMATPFSIAIAELSLKKDANAGNAPASRRTIYLAGGFRSNWQALATSRLAGLYELLDPSAHDIQDPADYTRWDLEAVRQSDIVLANMEASNPGGYSLALEIGFAKALDKRIFFIDQIEDPSVKRYFEMVRQCSERVFPTLGDALDHLSSLG